MMITVRPLSMPDLDKLQRIGKRTFEQAFGADNSVQQMNRYLRQRFSRTQLRRELHEPHSTFYFAETAGEPIGYLKLNFADAQTEPQDKSAVEIERIYVLNAWHGKGAGRALLQTALDIAQARRAPYIWLGVWEHNHHALAFYRKNGFIPFGTHVFQLGNDRQTDIMMKRNLA
ncbi:MULTISPECIES: GNAT family N-acetyltransferase [Pasteurellaceae]|uniref:GNAT family N-acetyltransferase n=1 Tax=Pasteurellaceae TaxID=712 RepID=UPI003566E957